MYRKAKPVRLLKFYYGGSVADPAYEIGAVEYSDYFMLPPPTVPMPNLTIWSNRWWRIRLARWLVDKLIPRKER